MWRLESTARLRLHHPHPCLQSKTIPGLQSLRGRKCERGHSVFDVLIANKEKITHVTIQLQKKKYKYICNIPLSFR